MEIRPVYAELKNDTFGLMFIFGIRPGRVVYVRGESGLLSSPALYAAPLCRLAFRYRLPDDFSGALRASIGNESLWRIDRKWNGTSSNDTCASTWSWRRVAQLRTNRTQIAPVSIRFEILNDSSSLCGPVALDDVESTDCDAGMKGSDLQTFVSRFFSLSK